MLSKENLVKNYLTLEDCVSIVRFVGPQKKKILQKLGIRKLRDLFFYFPRDYLDLSKLKQIAEIKVGEQISVRGRVLKIQERRIRPRLHLLSVTIADGTGFISGTWFNQQYRMASFEEGKEVIFSGRVDFKYGQLQIQNPLYDFIDSENLNKKSPVHTMRIIPIYPLTKNITSTMLRRYMIEGIREYGKIAEILPARLIASKHFLSRKAALKNIHFPENLELAKEARRRFLFEELFIMQIGFALRKKRIQKEEKGIKHKTGSGLHERFLQKMPFHLTKDQVKAFTEIKNDMSSAHPMNRLLQGEVGSGKTLVALCSLLITVDNNYQGVLMAPTEILAQQHFKKLKNFLDGLDIKIALLTGSLKASEKKEILDQIANGKINIIIGTHALIQKEVIFKKLGLAVIDEQHRFGVRQRIKIKKKGLYPDILIMTATPIPRTLSMTLYGDLDISVMKELPLGRNMAKMVSTKIFPEGKRNKAYQLIKEEIDKGRQAYIVCPLIEESDKLEVKAVNQEAERLKEEVFKAYKVEIIHGQMRTEEKEEIMDNFSRGNVDILISTTVIEVGIDIPNATVMLIEDAHRFGLSQLHQLRGRIGRGGERAYCLLISNPKTDEGMKRIKAIEDYASGFKLAEIDLEIRGEGQLFGVKQSGLPDLRLAKLTTDQDVIIEARKEAFAIIDRDPHLEFPENALLLHELKKAYKDNISWLFEA